MMSTKRWVLELLFSCDAKRKTKIWKGREGGVRCYERFRKLYRLGGITALTSRSSSTSPPPNGIGAVFTGNSSGSIVLSDAKFTDTFKALASSNSRIEFTHILRVDFPKMAVIDTVNIFASVGSKNYTAHETAQMIQADQSISLANTDKNSHTTITRCNVVVTSWGSSAYNYNGNPSKTILFKIKLSLSLCMSPA